MYKVNDSKGYTMVELLVALLITGILAMAGFKFYVRMHNQALAQDEVSEMQQNSRSSMEEMIKTLRMAGYKTGSHLPYLINGDSIYVFFNGTQPIDTVLFYLASYTTYDDSVRTQDQRYQLMVKVNSATPEIYADNIHDISFTTINSSTIRVDLDVQTEKSDEAFADNDGVRVFSCSERVNLRNLKL